MRQMEFILPLGMAYRRHEPNLLRFGTKSRFWHNEPLSSQFL